MKADAEATRLRQISVGLDLVDIRRIERVLERFGERFTHRIFTPAERARADRRPREIGCANGRAASYARRYAAKEACAKALGTGVPRRGVHWRHMEVFNLPSGAPRLRLTGGAEARARVLVQAESGEGAVPVWQVSLTDEYPYAQAVVFLFAETVSANES